MAEILKIREITIDTMQHKDFNIKEEELKLIRFYQNDLNSAKLLINVTHDKVVTDFSSATGVQIAFLKPDCKRVFQDVQNVNQMQGKYYVVLSTQTLIAYGNVIAQLRFTFPNNKVIETCKFAFTVDESIMSDDAMKSTNEFPVIQKAIEAGKKLEGVDIDGIIAAGELAKGALPKTGGTMTGALTFQGVNSQQVFKDSTDKKKLTIGVDGAGSPFAWNEAANKYAWKIENDGKFNVNADNLVGKDGIYLNWILPGGTPKAVPNGVDINTITESGVWQANGNPNLPNVNSQWFVIEVFRHTPSFVIQRATRFAGAIPEIFVRASRSGTFDPWKRVSFSDEVVTKAKDGRANITLNSGFTNFDTNYPVIADRRGNTVTLRGAVRRESGTIGDVAFTLPSDMIPLVNLPMNLVTNEGVSVRVIIATDGSVKIGSQNSAVYISFTYVVN
ncbi:hypothetical protein bcf_27890 (plasmid) [Bacillus cereus F837/76]|uniref:BppU family phage baseplate upper protein n=1 Tax=Bacillus cereus TaxID=1396 RepID=UPI000241E7AC|nr:BppU family phage baseplate upper protein [Bacillus cereus]AEW58667.1 hypothetical protein bcf_27890 [Bacillus cereus F837/76]